MTHQSNVNIYGIALSVAEKWLFMGAGRTAQVLAIAVLLCLIAAGSALSRTPNHQSREYAADTVTNFMNPERGWHKNGNFIGGGNFSAVRSTHNMTLIRCYVRLDNYRSSPLPQSLLDEHTLRFRQLREAGIKIILRYSYNFSGSGEDAPIDRVLEHIAQLKPYWQANADVIAVLQAGFIGAWGEWHSSTNGLTSADNRRRITEALLDALPASRMIQIRYPRYIMEFYPQPLDSSAAFTGSSQARIGVKNDSFLRNHTDAGTYAYPPQWHFNQGLKDYTRAVSPYVVMGGETVEDVTLTEGNRQSCPDAVAEMEMLNWDYLNRDYASSVITPWIVAGCFDRISLKLGYRLRLVRAELPQSVYYGEKADIRLEIANDGWGKVYNPRCLDLVFRDTATGKEHRAILAEDARRMLPGGGATRTLRFSTPLPAMPAGRYRTYLHLADPEPSISKRPEYSIRLANRGMWEESSGYNDLGMTVTVEPQTVVAPVRPIAGAGGASRKLYDLQGRAAGVSHGMVRIERCAHALRVICTAYAQWGRDTGLTERTSDQTDRWKR